MTSAGDHERGTLDEQSLETATADLERIRERLRAAAQGDIGGQELTDDVGDYWREHQPVLRAAAASLTEELRLRALDALYTWREQLDDQVRRGGGQRTSS